MNLAEGGVSSEANVTDIHEELRFSATPGRPAIVDDDLCAIGLPPLYSHMRSLNVAVNG